MLFSFGRFAQKERKICRHFHLDLLFSAGCTNIKKSYNPYVSRACTIILPPYYKKDASMSNTLRLCLLDLRVYNILFAMNIQQFIKINGKRGFNETVSV